MPTGVRPEGRSLPWPQGLEQRGWGGGDFSEALIDDCRLEKLEGTVWCPDTPKGSAHIQSSGHTGVFSALQVLSAPDL